MVMRLLRYRFKLKYVPGKELNTADTLSRDSKGGPFPTPYLEGEASAVHSLVSASKERASEIIKATSEDIALQTIIEYIRNGWPSHLSAVNVQVRPYWPHANEFHTAQGLLFRGQRLVIPLSQQADILEKIHSGHLGITLCKAKARESVYWPGMSKDIERYVKTCETCQVHSRSNQQEPLQAHNVPEIPWEKIGSDFMHVGQKNYIVAVDYHSKFVEVRQLKSTAAAPTIQALKSMFSIHGIPMILVTDNGPPFCSTEFKIFTNEWDIEHLTSSPKHPKSNGMIERTIQSVKKILTKAHEENKDPYLALLEFRSCPRVDLPSPSVMLMGRKIRTLLPGSKETLKPKFYCNKAVQSLKKRTELMQQKSAHCRPLAPLQEGNPVWVQLDNKKWSKAIVVKVTDAPRSYIVQTTEGRNYRRNRRHLKQRLTKKEGMDLTEKTQKSPILQQRQIHLPKTLNQPSNTGQVQHGCQRAHTRTDDCTRQQTIAAPVTTRSGREVRVPARFSS